MAGFSVEIDSTFAKHQKRSIEPSITRRTTATTPLIHLRALSHSRGKNLRRPHRTDHQQAHQECPTLQIHCDDLPDREDPQTAWPTRTGSSRLKQPRSVDCYASMLSAFRAFSAICVFSVFILQRKEDATASQGSNTGRTRRATLCASAAIYAFPCLQ